MKSLGLFLVFFFFKAACEHSQSPKALSWASILGALIVLSVGASRGEGEQAQEMGECRPGSYIRKGGAGRMVKAAQETGAWEADAVVMRSQYLDTLLRRQK